MINAPRRLTALIIAAGPLFAQSLPVTEHTLSNGMRLLLVERHDQPSISCGWVARVGSANERPGITGMAHLFEHMMFKGTKTIGTRDAKRDAELNDAQDKVQDEIRKELDILREKQRRNEIQDMFDPKVFSPRHQQLLADFDKLVKEQRDIIVKDEMDSIYTQAGATGLNANTSNDRTFYHITVPANKLELWAWLESDRLMHPVFREFYSERDVVNEERRQRVDSDPTGAIQEQYVAMLWQAHPYQWPVIGWPSDIRQYQRALANEFFATYYAPNNITTVLVGDFKTADAIKTMERYFGRIPTNPKGVPPLITLEPVQSAEQRMVAEADTNPALSIAFKTVPTVHKDTPALNVLSAILNGTTGRLYKELVLKQKVALGAGADVGSQKYGGNFSFYASPVSEQTPEAMEPLLYAEIAKIQKDGISDYELQKIKNHVEAATYTRFENNDSLRNQLAETDAEGTYKDFLTEPAKLQAVTKEDVQRVAQTYFVRDRSTTLVLHRKQGTQPQDDAFAKLSPEGQALVQENLGPMQKLGKEELKMTLGQMEADLSQVPPDIKPALEYLIQKVRERMQQLEAK